jgi:hypothetical protein
MVLVLTARGACRLIDWRQWRLSGGFFVVANDADDVLPPVDVIRKRRLTEIAGLASSVTVRDEYLKNNTHTQVSIQTAKIYRRNKSLIGSSSPLTGARWQEGPTSAATVNTHKTFHMVGYYVCIRWFLKTRRMTVRVIRFKYKNRINVRISDADDEVVCRLFDWMNCTDDYLTADASIYITRRGIFLRRFFASHIAIARIASAYDFDQYRGHGRLRALPAGRLRTGRC